MLTLPFPLNANLQAITILRGKKHGIYYCVTAGQNMHEQFWKGRNHYQTDNLGVAFLLNGFNKKK